MLVQPQTDCWLQKAGPLTEEFSFFFATGGGGFLFATGGGEFFLAINGGAAFVFTGGDLNKFKYRWGCGGVGVLRSV